MFVVKYNGNYNKVAGYKVKKGYPLLMIMIVLKHLKCCLCVKA